jgi:hypothetical protein
MKIPSDDQVLAWLRQRYSAQRTEMEALGALIAVMERNQQATPAEAAPVHASRRVREGDRKTTSDYVVEALRHSGRPMTKRDLVDALLAAGWQTDANDPSETVRYAIGVLINQGTVTKGQEPNTYVLATARVPDTYTVPQAPVAVVGGTGTPHGGSVTEM